MYPTAVGISQAVARVERVGCSAWVLCTQGRGFKSLEVARAPPIKLCIKDFKLATAVQQAREEAKHAVHHATIF